MDPSFPAIHTSGWCGKEVQSQPELPGVAGSETAGSTGTKAEFLVSSLGVCIYV